MAETDFLRLRPDQVAHWLSTRPDALVLDAREARHHAISHLVGCVRLDGRNHEALLMRQPKKRPVLIYCYHGNASQTWARMFCDFGFGDVADLMGGWAAVDRQGLLQGPQSVEAAFASPAAARPVPPALAAWLSAQGFDPAQPDAAGKHGNTPFMHAAWRGADERDDAVSDGRGPRQSGDCRARKAGAGATAIDGAS